MQCGVAIYSNNENHMSTEGDLSVEMLYPGLGEEVEYLISSLPTSLGKMSSLFICFSIHAISLEMYCRVGRKGEDESKMTHVAVCVCVCVCMSG